MAILFNQSALTDFSKALMTALSPITTISGIKIYDHVPQNQETYPYIVVGDMTEQSWGDKTAPGSQITVSINIYYKDKSSLSVKSIVDTITETLDTNFSVNNWELIYIELSDNSVSEVENSVYIGTVSLNFYLLEEQTTNATN